MSIAPYKLAVTAVAGCFRHAKTNACFEFANDNEGSIHPWDGTVISDYPQVLFLAGGTQTRRCKIFKTVAHVVVDETAGGAPVIEKWPLKMHWKR